MVGVEVIRFTPARWEWLSSLLGLFLLPTLTVGPDLLSGETATSPGLFVFGGALATSAVVFAPFTPGLLELHADHVVLRKWWWIRRTTIPWSDVEGIVVRANSWGGRDEVNFVSRGRVHRVNLPGSRTFSGRTAPDLDAKLDRLGQWWIDHRGPAWHPMPGCYPDGVWRMDLPPPPLPPPPYPAS